MRINEKSDATGIAKKEKKIGTKPTGSVTSALFAGRLTQVSKPSEEYVGELERLKDAIDKAGELLEQEPTITNFKAFRELIAGLAKKVSSEAYRMELLGSSTGRTHEIISVIDKEADLLYHLVMREQKDHIRIVAQIIRIKGLVVDLML